MITKTSTNKPSISMADLLKSHKTTFVDLTRGQTITGTITKLTPSEILLDINAKSEAVVFSRHFACCHRVEYRVFVALQSVRHGRASALAAFRSRWQAVES